MQCRVNDKMSVQEKARSAYTAKKEFPQYPYFGDIEDLGKMKI